MPNLNPNFPTWPYNDEQIVKLSTEITSGIYALRVAGSFTVDTTGLATEFKQDEIISAINTLGVDGANARILRVNITPYILSSSAEFTVPENEIVVAGIVANQAVSLATFLADFDITNHLTDIEKSFFDAAAPYTTAAAYQRANNLSVMSQNMLPVIAPDDRFFKCRVGLGATSLLLITLVSN